MPTALLLVDVQRNMLEPPEPVPDAAPVGDAVARVLEQARTADALVVHIRNNGEEGDPDLPGSPGWELVHAVRPGEHTIDKHVPDAFSGTPLAELIPESSSLVVVGMQSEYCVLETSLAALGRGHRVTLVTDAHATYHGDTPAQETSRRIEAELAAAGASLVTSEELDFNRL